MLLEGRRQKPFERIDKSLSDSENPILYGLVKNGDHYMAVGLSRSYFRDVVHRHIASEMSRMGLLFSHGNREAETKLNKLGKLIKPPEPGMTYGEFRTEEVQPNIPRILF